MLNFEDIKSTTARLGDSIIHTPTVQNEALSQRCGVPVFLKLENLQVGGTFKRRGVLSKFYCFTPEQLDRGVVAVSGGNFGRCVAETAREFNSKATIILPKSVPIQSVQYIQGQNARVVITNTVEEAFIKCDEEAENSGALILDDTADLDIAVGYGSLAIEMLADVPQLTHVVFSVGGGALLVGAGSAVKALKPSLLVFGAEPVGAPTLKASLERKEPTQVPVTTQISTLGVPKVSSLIFQHAVGLVNDIYLVSDEQAWKSCNELLMTSDILAEPAAGCSLAAAQMLASSISGDSVIGILICGGNVDPLEVRSKGDAVQQSDRDKHS